MTLEQCLKCFLSLYLGDIDDDLDKAVDFANKYLIDKGYIDEDYFS